MVFSDSKDGIVFMSSPRCCTCFSCPYRCHHVLNSCSFSFSLEWTTHALTRAGVRGRQSWLGVCKTGLPLRHTASTARVGWFTRPEVGLRPHQDFLPHNPAPVRVGGSLVEKRIDLQEPEATPAINCLPVPTAAGPHAHYGTHHCTTMGWLGS